MMAFLFKEGDLKMSFCINCGHKIDAEYAFCPECGMKVGSSMGSGENALKMVSESNRLTQRCLKCGELMPNDAFYCLNCGVSVDSLDDNFAEIRQKVSRQFGSWRNKRVSFFLCLTLGWLGAHKFYEGKVFRGLLYIFTFGLLGLGWFVDLVILLLKPNPYLAKRK